MRWRIFSVVWILDGSTLDALLRKVGLLREGKGTVLAGRLGCLLNAASLLPEEVWYEEDSQAHDQNFWERAAAKLPKSGLLLFDLGFINYTWFDTLSEQVRFFGDALQNQCRLSGRSSAAHLGAIA